MEIFDAVILSVVEGVTEFLPISSTGHLILTSKLLNLEQTEFVKSFEIIIQLGAILAVVFLYWKKLLRSKKIWRNILIAFAPTAILGFTLYKLIKTFLIGNSLVTLAALIIGGILLIILELIYQEKDEHTGSVDQLSIKQSFLIGLGQSVSMIPGVSRSAATIMSALFLGAKRSTAVEFSFFLAIPTMLAATAYDLYKNWSILQASDVANIVLGFVTAFIAAVAGSVLPDLLVGLADATKWPSLKRFAKFHFFFHDFFSRKHGDVKLKYALAGQAGFIVILMNMF